MKKILNSRPNFVFDGQISVKFAILFQVFPTFAVNRYGGIKKYELIRDIGGFRCKDTNNIWNSFCGQKVWPQKQKHEVVVCICLFFDFVRVDVISSIRLEIRRQTCRAGRKTLRNPFRYLWWWHRSRWLWRIGIIGCVRHANLLPSVWCNHACDAVCRG